VFPQEQDRSVEESLAFQFLISAIIYDLHIRNSILKWKSTFSCRREFLVNWLIWRH